METFEKIRDWARERNIAYGSSRKDQLCKLVEEVGELASSIGKNQNDLIKDAIGDCVVVLTILAYQTNLEIEQCIQFAYDQIKDRKGQLIDGVFVKEL